MIIKNEQQWYLNDTAAMISMKLFIEKMAKTDDLIARISKLDASGSQAYLYVHEDACRVGKFNDMYNIGSIEAYPITVRDKILGRFLATEVNHFTYMGNHLDGIVYEAALETDSNHDGVKWMMKAIPLFHSLDLARTFGLVPTERLHISDVVGQDWVSGRVVNVRRAIAVEIINQLQVIKHVRHFGQERMNVQLNSDPFYMKGITRAWYYKFIPALAFLDNVEAQYAD